MKRQRGFTLVELMIVVAIVGVLAAIAYPSYEESVRKSRRADARAVLLGAAQFMERRYTENLTTGYTGVVLPANLTVSPSGSAAGAQYYDISLAAVAQNTFTVQAVPTSAGNQSADKCKTLTLTNTGVKGVSTTATLPADECWR